MLWDSNSIALADSAKRIFSLSFTGGPSAVQRASISYPPLTELTFVNSHTDPAGVCSEDFVNSQALPSQKRSSAAQETRSEEHTSELQSLMRISYDVFCMKKKITQHLHSLPIAS